jgi:hypothetical protein
MQPLETNQGVKRYLEPRFEELTRDTADQSRDVIFMVDSEMRITYCNPAWDQFALANGGEDFVAARALGTDLMQVIPDPLHDFYSEAFLRCRRHHLPFDIDYECSSAQLYRLMHMNILPLKRSGELAFVNSVRVEHIHGAERPASSATDIYFSPYGMIAMCCHCRRTRRQDGSEVWDWVPAFLQTQNYTISHGICPACVSYYYSKYFTRGASSGPG